MYFNYEPWLNGVFSRNNLHIIQDGVYAKNLNEKQNKGTDWISLFVNRHMTMYFDYVLWLSGIEIARGIKQNQR